ncbi:MAG TPA: hypothetical protein PKL75_05495 [Treponemataceae bacterium]|nr:hypothetical protein [Treponemataceae bacterium]
MKEIERKIPLRAMSIAAAAAAFGVMVADYLLEYMSMPSIPVGSFGILETGMLGISFVRLSASVNICGFAIPFYLLGFYAIYRELSLTKPGFAKAYLAMTGFGIMTASLIHGVIVYIALAYNRLMDAGQSDLAVSVAESLYASSLPIFWAHYFLTWIIPQIMLIVLILRKKTVYGRAAALFNPFTFLIIGSAMKLAFPELLQPLYVGSINRGNVALFLMAAWYARHKETYSQ